MTCEKKQSTSDVTAVAQEAALQEFSSVIQSHQPYIFNFLLASLRDVELAETLTQECLLKAQRYWLRFRGDSSVRTWLIRIAINLQKDHWRDRRLQFWREISKNSVDVSQASEWLPTNGSSPEQQVAAREQLRQIWKVVEDLTEKQRTVFLLRYVEELEFSEIAHATGLNPSTVKTHLSRARAKVRAKLCEQR